MVMGMALIIPLLLVLSCAVGYFLVRKSSRTSLEIMLLGIAAMLAGGIVAADPGSSLGGVEYVFVLLGLVIVVAGFAKGGR